MLPVSRRYAKRGFRSLWAHANEVARFRRRLCHYFRYKRGPCQGHTPPAAPFGFAGCVGSRSGRNPAGHICIRRAPLMSQPAPLGKAPNPRRPKGGAPFSGSGFAGPHLKVACGGQRLCQLSRSNLARFCCARLCINVSWLARKRRNYNWAASGLGATYTDCRGRLWLAATVVSERQNKWTKR